MTASPSETPGDSGPAAWLRDYLYPVAASLFLLLQFLTLGGRPFWLDETFTVWFVRDPSLAHMLDANRDAINAFPPLYFLVLRPWAAVFGSGEFGLRSLSLICFIGAVWTLWGLLRRRYGVAPAAYALTAAVVLHPVVLMQNVQARQYGLMFLLGSLVLRHFAALTTSPRTAPAQYALHTLAHLAMILAHPITLLYSGCVLLGGALPDLIRRRMTRDTLWRAGSVIASWALFLLLWGREAQYQRTAFQPYSWIPGPTTASVLEFLLWYTSKSAALVLAATAAFLIFLGIRFRPAPAWRSELVGDGGYLFLTGVLLALLPGLILIALSVKGPSLFLDRYLILSGAGWAVVLAALFSCVTRARTGEPSDYSRVATVGVALLAAAFFLVVGARQVTPKAILAGLHAIPTPDPLESHINAPAVRSLPVVWTNGYFFGPARYYDRDGDRYYLPQDYDFVRLSGRNIGAAHSLFVNYSALQRHYPDAHAPAWADFAATHDRFLIYEQPLHSYGGLTWVDFRFRQDPRYRLTTFHTDGANTLYLAERIAPP